MAKRRRCRKLGHGHDGGVLLPRRGHELLQETVAEERFRRLGLVGLHSGRGIVHPLSDLKKSIVGTVGFGRSSHRLRPRVVHSNIQESLDAASEGKRHGIRIELPKVCAIALCNGCLLGGNMPLPVCDGCH